MRSEDFAAWLSAISGMSEGQRKEALAALEKAAAATSGADKAGLRGRQEDALGTSGVERVAAQGCPHCAGREIVGWGRSDGLLRYRCKSCRRTFNALTRTPMAHLRKKEKWQDHARAMIEGKSLAKTAELCGVHPTTAFRWRHRFLRAPSVNKPRTLRGIVEADETSFSNPSRASGPTFRERRAGGAARPGIQVLIKTAFPSWSRATGEEQLLTRSCPRSPAPPSARRLSASSRRSIIWSATAAGRSPASPVGPAFPSTPCLRRESPLPRRPISTSTMSTLTTAA
jgi:transposase-like protein